MFNYFGYSEECQWQQKIKVRTSHLLTDVALLQLTIHHEERKHCNMFLSYIIIRLLSKSLVHVCLLDKKSHGVVGNATLTLPESVPYVYRER